MKQAVLQSVLITERLDIFSDFTPVSDQFSSDLVQELSWSVSFYECLSQRTIKRVTNYFKPS